MKEYIVEYKKSLTLRLEDGVDPKEVFADILIDQSLKEVKNDIVVVDSRYRNSLDIYKDIHHDYVVLGIKELKMDLTLKEQIILNYLEGMFKRCEK